MHIVIDHQLHGLSIELGIKKIIVPEKFTEAVHKLGRIETISIDGDQKIGKDYFEHEEIIESSFDDITMLILLRNGFPKSFAVVDPIIHT